MRKREDVPSADYKTDFCLSLVTPCVSTHSIAIVFVFYLYRYIYTQFPASFLLPFILHILQQLRAHKSDSTVFSFPVDFYSIVSHNLADSFKVEAQKNNYQFPVLFLKLRFSFFKLNNCQRKFVLSKKPWSLPCESPQAIYTCYIIYFMIR